MNGRTLAQILTDGIEATTIKGYTDRYVFPGLYVNGLIDIRRLADYIRDAYTLRTRTQLDAAPVGSLACDLDRDALCKDGRGWYILGEGDWGFDSQCSGADPGSCLPALMMPWQWDGEDEALRSVDVLMPQQHPAEANHPLAPPEPWDQEERARRTFGPVVDRVAEALRQAEQARIQRARSMEAADDLTNTQEAIE